MKFFAFCKTLEFGNDGKSSRFEAESFESMRVTLVREFALLPFPTRFLICDEHYKNAYSGIILDSTFYFMIFNYKTFL